jgi:hypothetical protein
LVSDVDKAFKMNGNDKTVVPSLIDSMTKKPVNQRSSERASTRLRIDSPSKAASEKKAPKPSAKKPKPKEPTPEPEEESAPRSGSILTEDPSVLYRIGNNQFHKGRFGFPSFLFFLFSSIFLFCCRGESIRNVGRRQTMVFRKNWWSSPIVSRFFLNFFQK